ncbi:MAG TPA: hypothetical protein VFX48_01505, partial [Saprospiraceae bacterium]|nr:hypothetical protein [Saprospiraceae bacterium]
MKTIFFILGMGLLFFSNGLNAQIKNLATATVEVNGNCEMCQKKIQTAAFKKGVSSASWDMETHMAVIQY